MRKRSLIAIMAAGALVFALVTTVLAVRVLRRADFHYFASY